MRGKPGMNRWTFATALALALPPMPILSQRDLLYLDLAFRQTKQFERTMPHLDPERLGSAALEAAALASAGRSTADDAARYLATGLDDCAELWQKVHCERMLLAFQRVALQFPEVVPEPLLTRLRRDAAGYLRPPGEAAVRDPWDFRETENQRAVRLARCLAALQVDPGEPGSARAAAAQAWGEAAAAFLRAHDRDGWYEAESPGYTATSITALLQIADHAPQPAVRLLARRQLDLLFADWAQRNVGGFPAGPKSRSYVHWSLGARNTPWVAWAWMAAELGDERRIWFMDWPEIATSGYVIPEGVARLLAGRSRQPAYEIRIRRSIALPGRRDLDTALYSFATPDYILGAAQSLHGLSLGVSGGQEIMATLFPAGREFAPLYLWSRTQNPRSERWKSWAGHDFTVGSRNVVLARLAFGSESEGEGTGHAYLSPPWEPPQRVGEDVVVSRYGDTYVALVTAGGWDVEPAPRRFPRYYGGDPAYRDAWVAVPRAQPAAVALEAGRRAEAGSFARWRARVAASRLTVADGELRYAAAADGPRITFLPGERAAVDGKPLDVSYPLLSGPFLSSPDAGRWTFSFGSRQVRFAALPQEGAD